MEFCIPVRKIIPYIKDFKTIFVINTQQLTDVFFDLDHTLWDFEKNSALTFKLIFDQLNHSIDVNDFLKQYVPINHACWKLYR
jgi:hypothetical protein